MPAPRLLVLPDTGRVSKRQLAAIVVDACAGARIAGATGGLVQHPAVPQGQRATGVVDLYRLIGNP